ncbi:MAG: efflux RND transporter periplasmic adaptor subunit [Steroidobacter sp.]
MPPQAGQRDADLPRPSATKLEAMDRTLPPLSFARKYGTGIGLSAVVILLLTILLTHYGRADTLYVDKNRLTIATVQQGAFQEFVPLTGAVAPIDSVYIDIAEPGQVAEIYSEAGDSVTAGQVLIRVTSTAPENELMNSENLLAQQVNALSSTKLQYEQTRLNTETSIIDMHASLEKLMANHQRLLKLKDSGAVAQADLDDMSIEMTRQQQSLVAMEKSMELSNTEGRKQIATMQRVIDTLNTKLDLARKNLDRLHVRAPISGQLTSFNVHVGQLVMPAQRIGQIDRIDHTKIVAAVDEFYLNRVAVHQQATAAIDQKTYTLGVTKIYPEVHDHIFNVDLTFDGDAPGNMHIGQSMDLRLNISAVTHALLVANGAFYDSGNQDVFVVDNGGNTAERRTVILGRRNADQVEILSGLSAGERLVVSGYQSYNGINQLRFR